MLWGGKEGGGSADSLVLEAQSFPCWSPLWLHHSLWGEQGGGGWEFSAFQMALGSNRKGGCKNIGGFIYMD